MFCAALRTLSEIPRGFPATMQKSLDAKLARIRSHAATRDFILADAKDADMAFGLSAPGQSPEHHSGEAGFKTLDDYRQQIREILELEDEVFERIRYYLHAGAPATGP